MIGDLTTVAKVKVYLGRDPADTSQDAQIAALVSSQSRIFRRATRRDILYQRYVETRDGEGTPGIEPRQYPVQKVESVVVDGNTIPALPALVAGQDPGYGWVVSNDRIEIRSHESRLPFVLDSNLYGFFNSVTSPNRFSRGPGNVVLTYWAGFLVPGEAATIPASPFQVQAQDNFYSDQGMTLADGVTTLAKVTGVPATGQYAVSSAGLYTFAAADAGKGVLLTYGIVPTDVEQAVNELVAYRLKGVDHTGERSHAISGATVYFETDAIPNSVQEVVDDYSRKSL